MNLLMIVCLVVALVLFLVSTFGVLAGRINLMALGLAFVTLAMLLGGMPVLG